MKISLRVPTQPMRTRPAARGVASLVALLLLGAACAAPATTPSAVASASAPATPTPSPEPSSQEPTPSPSADASCDSDSPTSASDSWPRLDAQSGDFSFAYPEGWEDITGLVRFNASSVVDEETFAETGLSVDDPAEADSVRHPSGFPNFSVFEIPGVTSSLDDIYDRQETRLATEEEIDELDVTDIEGCVADEPARALDLSFFDRIIDPATGESELTDTLLYQQSLWFVHDGVLYYVQWLDEDRSETGVLEEMLRTWEWSDGAAAEPEPPGGEDPFELAATADEVDASRDEPDPATFTSVFAADAPAIYVVYRLKPGLSGTINLSWYLDGAPFTSGTLDIPEGRWAYGGIEPPTGGFPTGSWEVELELADTGGSRTLEFTVEPAG